MGGRLALAAKIVRRRDDAATKMMLPDTIDHDERSKRIGRIREPLGQFQPSARGSIRGQLLSAKNCRKVPRYFLPQTLWVPPNVNPGVCRLAFGDGISIINRRDRGCRFC